jgi:hypothetical protein
LTVEEIGYLFSNFGAPIVFAMLMYVMYEKNHKWWQEQAIAQDKRHQEQITEQNKIHQELTKTFVDEINKIHADNRADNKAINACLNELTTNIDTHIKQKDELIRLANINIDLLKQKDSTINELFIMLREQIKTNRQ